jgi:hypothetical protein
MIEMISPRRLYAPDKRRGVGNVGEIYEFRDFLHLHDIDAVVFSGQGEGHHLEIDILYFRLDGIDGALSLPPRSSVRRFHRRSLVAGFYFPPLTGFHLNLLSKFEKLTDVDDQRHRTVTGNIRTGDPRRIGVMIPQGFDDHVFFPY